MLCAKCGADNRDGAKFCNECAAPMAAKCSHCGAINQPGAKFCDECGEPLTARAAKSKVRPESAPSVRMLREGAVTNATEVPEGERKTVTALFADIKGSTELMEDLDPEEARAIIDPALKLMIEAVQRYDGYVVQSTGDGIFALFGAPVAHEDHPQRALYAALRMQEELKRYSANLVADGGIPIQCRVGANTGEVVVRSISTGEGHTEYTPIGHTANLASRMQAVAQVGSIAISEHTRKLVEGYFALKPLGPTKVKGVSEPVNVYEVTGLGPLRTRLQRAVGRGLTKFVGREREMDAMRAAADRAISGHGQIVAAMAEAGAGKSRLFFEFKATHQCGWMVLETFSVSHGKASAYLPVLDLLHSYFDIKSDDEARKRREKVNGRIVTLDPALEDTRPYLFALLGIVEGQDPLVQMDANIRKRRTLEAIKRILLRESMNQPLMVIFEDLHWIDEQTQEFLNLLADSIGTAKILVLVNYRPEYSHQWNSKTYYTQLRLDPLGKESADEMLSTLLGEGDDLTALKHLIIEKTEGNPFFMEETVQVLFDEGALARDGAVVNLTRSLNTLKIPPTVQGILTARIDRLPSDAKDLLQALAVIGREFPLSLIRAVVPKPDDEVSRLLNDLQLGEFIYEQPAVGDTEYIFNHALTQEVSYNSVLIERRKQLHERIGTALEALHASTLDDHLAELAHHYGRANNPAKAVHYLTGAGKQALDRSAFAEAYAQLQKGNGWIKALPESPERDARELDLMSPLVRVLSFTRGFTATETVEAAVRASVLAEKGGDLTQVVLHGFGVWVGAINAGNHGAAGTLADRMLAIAGREGGAMSLAFAHRAQIEVRYYRGDLVGVEEQFARLSESAEEIALRRFPGAFVSAMGFSAQAQRIAGHGEEARRRIAQAIAYANASRNPFDLAVARYFASRLSSMLCESERAETAAAEAITICEEHGFPYIGAMSRTVLGWARMRRGGATEAVALIRECLADMAKMGARLALTEYIRLLAEAQALDGSISDALETIEEALSANPEDLIYRPGALTSRGELRLRVGQPALAEADFREAIARARGMGAIAYHLRTTTSLARLLCDTNRRGEARTTLAEIYNSFTEGFDTADLIDAKTLLDELSH